MKRYPAYEFPEYVNWQADPEVQAEFETCITQDAERKALIDQLTKEQHLSLYEGLVSARLHDVQLKRWVKQGVITKAWLGSGEEAVTVGGCAALEEADVCGPMIRNASCLFLRGMSLMECFAGYLGTTDTITGGRDLHIGDPDKGVIPPISHIGDLVPVMTGCAMGFRLKKEPRVAITWTGDGSTATGAFHEGIRMAASVKAPLVCVIQNNQVALGTTTTVHSPGDFTAFGAAYGVTLLEMEGNNVLDCYATTQMAVDLCRRGEGPVLISTRTFRMGGHATHDEREARDLFPDDLYAYWGKRDPIGMYETWLKENLGISPEELSRIEEQALERIDTAAREAASRKDTHQPDPSTQTKGVFA